MGVECLGCVFFSWSHGGSGRFDRQGKFIELDQLGAIVFLYYASKEIRYLNLHKECEEACVKCIDQEFPSPSYKYHIIIFTVIPFLMPF